MASGQWDVVFDYGRIIGTYKCSNTLLPDSSIVSGRDRNGRVESYRVGDPGNTQGNYCYCKATAPTDTNWVYHTMKNNSNGTAQNCNSACAGVCAGAFRESTLFRKIMFNKR